MAAAGMALQGCLRPADPLDRLRALPVQSAVQLRQQECGCWSRGEGDGKAAGAHTYPQPCRMLASSQNRGMPGVSAVREQQVVEDVDLAVSRFGIVLMEPELDCSALSREFSPAGDQATSLERSLLERQWALSLEEFAELEKKSRLPRRRRGRPGKKVEEGEEQGQGEGVAGGSGRVRFLSSGKPSARQRRLQARKKHSVSSAPGSPLIIRSMKKPAVKGGRPRQDGFQDYLTTYLRDITKIDLLTKEDEIELSKKMKLGEKLRLVRASLESELGYAASNDQLAAQVGMSTSDLLKTLTDADLARDKMVMSNLRLVVSVAKRYNNRGGLELADLIQEGSIGLVRGVEKFDHTRGYKLSTYVHWWIRQGVTRAIADHSSTVRIPVHVHDTLARIKKARNKITSDGCTPTIQNISKALHISDVKVRNALKTKKRLKSIDREIGRDCLLESDKDTFHTIIPDRDMENHPWALVDRALLKEDVNYLLSSILSQREQDIVRMHYGVGSDGHQLSFDKIGLRHGVSRERARQLGTSAIRKLQLSTQSKGLERTASGI